MPTFLQSGKIAFNVSGGSVTVDPTNGTVKLSSTSGMSTNIDLAHVSASYTLTAGPISMSLSSNGNGSYSFKDGLVSGTLGYNAISGTVTNASITLGYSAGGALAGLDVALMNNNGNWTGTATTGITVPTSASLPVFGSFNIPGATWVNNKLSSSVSFSPSTTDPCTLLGNGLAAEACKILENGAQAGSINVNEQKALQELGLSGETFTPLSDGAGGSLLFGSTGTVISMNSTGAGTVYSSAANGQGLIYSDYNSTGGIVDADVAGQGGSLTLNNTITNIAANSQVTITGSACTINAATGDTVGLIGGNNTINGGANEHFWLSGTKGAFDTVNMSGDNSGTKAADGSAGGVWMDSNAQANLNGSNNTTYLGTGDSMGEYGGGNTINSGANDLVVIGNTNGNFDNVYANGDQFGGATANGQGTGIYMNANSQVNVTGSNDGIALATGDSMGAYGGGNTINSGVNDLVVIGNTNGNFDTVNATNDRAGGATANGQGTGIGLNGNVQANVYGSNSNIVEGASDKVNVYASGDITTANGTDDLTQNYGTNDYTYAYGAGDRTNNYGSGDTTYNYGNQDQTNNFGSNEHAYDYGSNEFAWDANVTDTAYEANASDITSGASFGGYYGYYGFAGKESTIAAAMGTDIGVIAQYDSAHGDQKGAAAAEKARKQVQSLLASAGQSAVTPEANSVLTGSQWDHQVINWSLASQGSQFSGPMGKPEEAAVQQAFAAWGEASGLTFKEVDDSAQSDIRIGWGKFDTANTGVVGYTTFESKAGHMQAGAAIRVEDKSQDALVAGADGQLIYAGTDAAFSQVLMHEIGHALGLADNADAGSIESYYMGGGNRKLNSNDVKAVQSLYGTLSGRAPGATQGVDQLVQAMASFASNSSAQIAALASRLDTMQSLLSTSHH